MEGRRRAALVVVAWLVAVGCVVVGIWSLAAMDPPMTGRRTDPGPERVGGTPADLASDDGLPPPELEDGRLHATIDGRVQPEALEDGAVVDRLGRGSDGRCNPAAASYGVARLDKGGPNQDASISLDEDRCAMVAHLDGGD